MERFSEAHLRGRSVENKELIPSRKNVTRTHTIEIVIEQTTGAGAWIGEEGRFLSFLSRKSGLQASLG